MKKLLIALIGLAFAFSISSCENRGKRCMDRDDCPQKEERQHRRW